MCSVKGRIRGFEAAAFIQIQVGLSVRKVAFRNFRSFTSKNVFISELPEGHCLETKDRECYLWSGKRRPAGSGKPPTFPRKTLAAGSRKREKRAGIGLGVKLRGWSMDVVRNV